MERLEQYIGVEIEDFKISLRMASATSQNELAESQTWVHLCKYDVNYKLP